MQMPRTYLCRDYRIISRNEKLMKILFKGTTITSWDFRWWYFSKIMYHLYIYIYKYIYILRIGVQAINEQ